VQDPDFKAHYCQKKKKRRKERERERREKVSQMFEKCKFLSGRALYPKTQRSSRTVQAMRSGFIDWKCWWSGASRLARVRAGASGLPGPRLAPAVMVMMMAHVDTGRCALPQR
jgi:hypothetical protein